MALDTAVHPCDREALLEEAAMWRFFHDLFRPPTTAQWEWLHQDATGEAWCLLASHVHGFRPARLPLAENRTDYETVYLAIFEVGMPRPPCPLIESHWNRQVPVSAVLHENLLTYQRFGLRLRSSTNERPDHLRHQLEFLHYLCRLEAEALPNVDRHAAAARIARARTEYLQAHLGYWVPRAADALSAEHTGLWTTAWIAILSACCSPQC